MAGETYTSSQNNRSSDANRKSLTGVTSTLTSEVTRATAAEAAIRNNLSTLISVIIDSALSPTSTNPVENKVITTTLAGKAEADTQLATVATTGSYNSLTNTPSIPTSETVDSILSETSTNAVGNKWVKAYLDEAVEPSVLKTVATTGSYTDLTNKPTPNTTFYVGSNGEIYVESTQGSLSQAFITNIVTTNSIITSVIGRFQDIDGMPVVEIKGGVEGSGTATFSGATRHLRVKVETNGNIYTKRWTTPNQTEPASWTLAAYGTAWWDGQNFPVLADKQSDMFPTSGSNSKCVCSHGVKQVLVLRDSSVASVEEKRTVVANAVSDINARIGDLTA